jgi:zinc transporter ZupT
MTKSKQTIPDLMIITGAMLVLCAIPVGVVFGFQRQEGVQTDLRWEIITGVVMTLGVGVTGGLLLWIGETIVQRRWKRDDENDHGA